MSSDVAAMSVALHLNSATFKSQITDAYQKAGQASKKFNNQAKAQADELSAAIARTVDASKNIGGQSVGADKFSGVTRGAGQLNFVLHEVAAGSNVASSTIINALIPAIHSLKSQLDGSAGGWQTQQDAARNAAQELASAAKQQITVAQAEKQAAISKASIAEKTIAAAAAQREEAIALDDYYAKRAEVNKQYGLSVSYQDEHLKNERIIVEANRLEAAGLEKLKAAKAAAVAADLAETEGKAALITATEAAAVANTQLSVSQRIAATSSRALSTAMSLLGGPVGIGLSVLAAGGTLIYSEFRKAEEQTKKLNAAVLDLSTSSLVSSGDLKRLNNELGNTENSVDAVSAAAKAGFSGKMLTDVATLANSYAEAGGSAQELVNQLASLRGDPLSAMEKLTASGIQLSDSIVSQVVALNQQGDAAQATQIVLASAMKAQKERLGELGQETEKTTKAVSNLTDAWAGAEGVASNSLINMAAQSRLATEKLRSMARQLAADVAAAGAAAQNERIKNSADLKNYMAEGTSAVEKRAAAIKKLNNSIYSTDSDDYRRILKGINDEYNKANKKSPQHKSTTESEGQRALEQAQQRNAVLKEQAKTTDKMTESARQLVAFDAQISSLKGQHLTAGQQSLVNMQGQIRAQIQSNVLLEREAVLRKTSEKYQEEAKKWAEEAEALKREAALSLDKYSKSDRETADAESRNGVINRFNQRRVALEKDFTDKTSSEYQARLADLENEKNQELAITKKSASDRLNAEADYSAGFRRGTLNWVDSARDANSQLANYATGLFDSMTDSVAAFVTTGKGSFRDFTTSVLSDLAKIAARVALSSALQSIVGAAGNLFSGGASAGGNAGTALSAGSISNLTFNATGGVYDTPSLSSYSGQVYNSPQVFAFANGAGVFGEAGPEAIMPLTRAADGSLGVRSVSDSTPSSAPEGGVNVYVTIDGSGNQQNSATSGYEHFGSSIGEFVSQKYNELIRKDLRPGGQLYTAMKGR